MTNMLEVNIRRNVTEELINKVQAVHNSKSDMSYHVPVLSTVAARCNSVLELGVRGISSTWPLLYGLSAESFGQAILVESNELGFVSEQKLVSIDIEDPSIHGADINEVYRIAEENNIDFRFIKGSTLDSNIVEGDFGAIFFDTDHTYEQLSSELKIWGPRAKTWMMFHDTTRFGKVLIPAINEFLQEHSEWIIVPNMSTNNCMGFTTLAKITVDVWESYVQEKYSDRIGKLL